MTLAVAVRRVQGNRLGVNESVARPALAGKSVLEKVQRRRPPTYRERLALKDAGFTTHLSLQNSKPLIDPRRQTGKRTVVLHAGLQKTGTTALQAALFRSRSVLSEHGITYWGARDNHSYPLALAFDVRDDRFGSIPNSMWTWFSLLYGESVQLRDGLFEQYLASKNFLISAELVSLWSEMHVQRLADCFSEADRHVVIYLRDVRAWITSLVQERLKTGNTISESLNSLAVLPLQSRVERMEWFGPVSLRRYRPEGLLVDFLGLLGELPPVKFEMGRENSTLSHQGVTLMDGVYRRVREAGADTHYAWLTDEFVRKRLSGSRFVLPKEALDEIVHNNREQLDWLSARAGFDVREPETLEMTTPEAPPDEKLIDLVADMTEEIHRLRQEVAALRLQSPGMDDEQRQEVDAYLRTLRQERDMSDQL